MAEGTEAWENKVIVRIRDLKEKKFGDIFVERGFSGIVYRLILMTSECGRDRSLMDLIGRWRKENEMWYLSQFPVTVERTSRWFINNLIEVPDRLLFIIRAGEEYIGHIGLFRFDFKAHSCEIDNILRGEKKYPGIIGDGIIGMMKWGMVELGLKGYTLKVLSDNERAIRLYEKIGYRVMDRIPLIQKEGKDGLEWTEAPEDYKGNVQRYYVIMDLSDKSLLTKN